MPKTDHNIIQSFSFAVKGILYALKHERNLRIHVAAAAYVLYFAFRYYDLSRGEYALLTMVIGLVITCELFNTAIEKTVDIETPVFNGLAKIAKDVAAGAVLVSALAAVASGLFLLWDPVVFRVIALDVADHFALWLPVLLATLVWVIWPRRKAITRRLRKRSRRGGEQ